MIEGQATTFGTSGLLYRSNKVMYDRATNSLWSQLLGEPVIGPLAHSGIKLRILPVVLTTWGEWLAEHPDTTVLALETEYYSFSRRYPPESDPRSFYSEYRASPETMFPVWNRQAILDTKDRVLALSFDGVNKAYPVDVLQRERLVNDQVDGTQVVIIASSNSPDTRVYAREGRLFGVAEGDAGLGGLPSSLVDSGGVQWRVTDDGLVNTADPAETLERLPSHLSFWFGWYAFHPDTLVFGAE